VAARRSKLLVGGWSPDRSTAGRDGRWVTRRGTRHAQSSLDRASCERFGACGPVVGPTSRRRALPETAELEDGRSAPADSPRATIRRCTWTFEPGASSKVTSLFMLVTGSPPVATPVVPAALVALCGTNTLSSLGFAALVRALRSSSPTPVHPPRRLGVGVDAAASRWSPGRAALSRSSLQAPACGEGSSELEPRRQLIRAGASVSDRR
jgi:hypothetical protein